MNFDPFNEKPSCLHSLNVTKEPTVFNDFPFIIAINKPAGITSFDCIRRMRPRLFHHLGKGKGRRKLKIGHFGTLDPFADGVLLVGTGKAMKVMNLVQEALKKRYLALCEFGNQTLTGDLDGEVIKTYQHDKDLDLALKVLRSVQKVGDELVGEYWQKPPYFSAVKHEGKPLYEYAREGVFIEKDPVCRNIYDLETKASEHDFHYLMNCSVSSGTYIRALWQDMLVDYDRLGHLKALTRTEYGEIHQDDCTELEEFCTHKSEPFRFFTPWELLKFSSVELSKKQAGGFLQGAFIVADQASEISLGSHFWVTLEGETLGLAESFSENGSVKLKAKINFY